MVLAKNRKGILFPCRSWDEWRFMLLFPFYFFHFFIFVLFTWCVIRVRSEFNKSFSMFDIFSSNFFFPYPFRYLIWSRVFFFFFFALFSSNERNWNIISIFVRKWRMEMRVNFSRAGHVHPLSSSLYCSFLSIRCVSVPIFLLSMNSFNEIDLMRLEMIEKFVVNELIKWFNNRKRENKDVPRVCVCWKWNQYDRIERALKILRWLYNIVCGKIG